MIEWQASLVALSARDNIIKHIFLRQKINTFAAAVFNSKEAIIFDKSDCETSCAGSS